MNNEKPGKMEVNISHNMSNRDNYRKVVAVKSVTAELIRNSFVDMRYF
ncbi:MAG TPA: hypothetical protein PKM65_02895 [Spirochaetota bacterium]|nr:hypothetical protein [Spirochaetota bacterium]HNT11969.1 hypothetical protein [Spirochaetota bacterium]HNV46869.1 hypothetical protein [Spirochaetota bacterium]HOS40752.1 hypothetical protein [Spirochaetota bacterium]HPU88485.1 hypothetical protein [Spirochaetota bacterium]